MTILEDRLASLHAEHATALNWFVEHAGRSVEWSAIIDFVKQEGGTRLVTQAKGIYKPQASEYAFSVRQTLSSPYADKEIVTRPDGSWVYPYFQENSAPSKRDDEYTNRGLMKCLEDGVPVGVLVQEKPKPGVEYRVLGLALVSDWRSGYFILEGFAPNGLVHLATEPPDAARDRALPTELGPNSDSFDPSDIEDLRRRSISQVVRRRGQASFRVALIAAYNSRCAISGCDAVEALEAAHITPYRGDATDHVQNGLILRADLHSLFDLGLIAIDAETMTVVLHPKLRDSSYANLERARINLPDDNALAPSSQALAAHRAWTGL